MIQALQKNGSMMISALKTARTDYDKGIEEIRDYLENEGIKESAQKEIDTFLKLADEKINGLPIDKHKLLYFSEIIKKRGH